MMIGSRQGLFFLDVELQVDRLKKSRRSGNPGRGTGQVPVHRIGAVSTIPTIDCEKSGCSPL